MHPEIQKKGLEKTIKANTVRHPLIVSKRSNLLVAGHGRLEVYKALGMKKVPVSFQEFESEGAEYKFMTSDNESQRKSWLDAKSFYDTLEELEIDTEVEPLEEYGIYDELANPSDDTKEARDQEGKEVKVQCPKCQHLFNI